MVRTAGTTRTGRSTVARKPASGRSVKAGVTVKAAATAASVTTGDVVKGGRTARGKAVGAGVTGRPAARGWTKARRREFLECLATSMNVRASARAVGVSEQSAYRLRARDEDFRAGWREAIAEAYERLELEMLRRAIGGEDEAEAAAKAGARNPDARLAMFLMKMHRETARGARNDEEIADDAGMAGDALEAKLADMRERMGLTEQET